MEKIIEFSKDYSSIYSKIIRMLKMQKGKEYSLVDITNYANLILENSKCINPKRCQTLIVKITKEFGIAVYHEAMKKDINGCIKIGGDTKQKYKGNNKVILLNNNLNEWQERVDLAKLLSYYLFDYFGSVYQEENQFYYAELEKKNHDIDKIADRFAMDILTPKELFVEQYNLAVKTNNQYYFVLRYLSCYFEVPKELIKKRIADIQYNCT